ncbi:GFA family protein [Dyella sp. ASV21]|jgi:hypothetical protein|uniref:GFA family protein n=1 Tax=Dyella sp. ASV21 TaxID=2795114 RepID=UPI0018EE352D|nr:GFA family protein [Dyella sp. ASV21]
MTYQGSCHCGDIAFTVALEPGPAVECNCSICSRKGLLLWFAPRTQFQLSTPEENVASYRFNRHAIDHRFCPRCGCEPFAFATSPHSGEAMVAVNVRCLENVELDAIERKPFDGRHLL